MNYLHTRMDQFSIKDLERLSGINAHTLRVWERRYGIIEPERTETNRRRYSGSDLRRIINIAILNRNGYKISKIAKLKDAVLEEKVADLLVVPSQTETEMDAMVISMLALDANAVNDILMKSILGRGFEDTVTLLIFPFMHRIGVMWQTGTVDTGYEHFITSIFRNRIISALESLTNGRTQNKSRVLLYLPENELHELAILFFAYLIKKSGHEILYMGQMTPLESVISISKEWQPSMIVTGASTGLPVEALAYLRRLTKEFPDTKIVVAGTFTSVPGIDRISNIISVNSTEDLRGII
jgi:MerR family transcriptional regulator, light-induced transcriptional regulator